MAGLKSFIQRHHCIGLMLFEKLHTHIPRVNNERSTAFFLHLGGLFVGLLE